MTAMYQGRRLMVCNCERTMEIDGEKLAAALGIDSTLKVYSHLCRTEIESFEAGLSEDAPMLVACTQEAPLFQEIAEENSFDAIAFTNIRERAGWSQAKGNALAKMAALISEAILETEPAGTTPIMSEGICLVYGSGQATLDTAVALAGRLSVSVMLTDANDVMPPSIVDVPIYKGRITKATGTLGKFEISVDDYAPAIPSSRDELGFTLERNGATSTCDVILDMSGGTALFPATQRRDGYFHVDPNHPASVAKAMFEIADYVGEFEKPLYVTYKADICAHGRSGKVGCSNCVDNCPTSAITPAGETVVIDPLVCGGCGNCSAMCPTGAVSYTYPGRESMIARCRALLDAYSAAGGANPILMLHDESHGSGIISAMARFGRGLPANFLPLSLYTVTQPGHEALLAALAAGAQQIIVLASPEKADELVALESQAALTNHIMTALGYGDDARVKVVVEQDPDAVEDALYSLPKINGIASQAFTAIGGKREIARTVLSRLQSAAPEAPDVIALPESAPYGRIQIDTQGCTLCLACVGACPADALADDPDRPMVRFTEAACVQCGLCKATCPENVISLEPRYDFSSSALTPKTLNEDEPFPCVRCGTPFGSKGVVERIVSTLEGKHWMYEKSDQLELIKMCDNCRVIAMSEQGDDPFAGGERPQVRTTDDYLAAEEQARKTGKTPDDFLN